MRFLIIAGAGAFMACATVCDAQVQGLPPAPAPSPLDQALSNKVMQEVAGGITFAVDAISARAELAEAQRRLAEVQAELAALKAALAALKAAPPQPPP